MRRGDMIRQSARNAVNLAIPRRMQHHGNMVVGRFFGWLVLFAASAVVVRDTLVWADTRALEPLSLGGLWSNLDASGLIAARRGIEHMAPWLWNWALGPALAIWALPALATLGVFLLWSCRRPRQRRFG